jgi:hypothetical protein
MLHQGLPTAQPLRLTILVRLPHSQQRPFLLSPGARHRRLSRPGPLAMPWSAPTWNTRPLLGRSEYSIPSYPKEGGRPLGSQVHEGNEHPMPKLHPEKKVMCTNIK